MHLPTIPRWRLALTGGAIVVLGVVGIGLAQAAPSSPAPAADAITAAASPGPGAGALPRTPVRRLLVRALVHGSATFDRPNKGLVTVQVDHGIVSAVGNGTVTIGEAGGTGVIVRTDDRTRLRENGTRLPLADLKVGEPVYALSLVQSGQSESLARLIVVPRTPSAGPAQNAPASPAAVQSQ